MNQLLKIEIAILISAFLSKEEQTKINKAVEKLDKSKVVRIGYL